VSVQTAHMLAEIEGDKTITARLTAGYDTRAEQ